VYEQVFGLDIAVQDAFGTHHAERTGKIEGDAPKLLEVD
jgi:hypothetical protein